MCRDEIFARQSAERDGLKVRQSMIRPHDDQPIVAPEFVQLKRLILHRRQKQADIDLTAPEGSGLHRARQFEQV